MGIKKNQKVILQGCTEAEVYPNVVFSVSCDSYVRNNMELIKLKELGGEWHVDCLRALTQKEVSDINKQMRST